MHLVEVFRDAFADAAIIAGMTHSGDYTIAGIKTVLCESGIPVRMTW
jgi:imidazole glycerol phosphate synthase subunit HisF